MSRFNSETLIQTISEMVGANISSLQPVSGGCISNAFLCQLANGLRVFAKCNEESFIEVFSAEETGLRALRDVGAVAVPQVLGVRQVPGQFSLIVMEAVAKTTPGEKFFLHMGEHLAHLHQKSQHDRCGWHHDNFLGSTRQKNSWNENWIEFFRESRLEYQAKLLMNKGRGNSELFERIEWLQANLEQVLGGSEELPVLLHGDLWSGNYLCDRTGMPVLIDPACYFGHREAEFGMLLLFGNCPDSFYESYHATWPLAEGWSQRAEVYRLYHLLNHLNLFGQGYLGDCLSVLRQLAS
jgi:fructosamine-3-kinase